MDKSHLTVGQMARINNVSEQTLRLYAKNGLLEPAHVDAVTGYRYYHITQCARLDLIQSMKLYGMTLKEIKKQLSNESLDNLHGILVRQLEVLDEKIYAMKLRRRAIERRLDNLERCRYLPKDEKPFLQYMPARYAYCYKTSLNYFESLDMTGYESMLRELKTHLLNKDIPISDFCNVGTVLRKKNLVLRNFFSNEVFILLDGNSAENGAEALPRGLYYCICSDAFSREKLLACALLDEIKSKGYSIAGDYYCEVVMEISARPDTDGGIFYKIQIPVKSPATASDRI